MQRRSKELLQPSRPSARCHQLAEYTTELINLLNVLGRLVELEPAQADLLERICSGETIPNDELREAGVFAGSPGENSAPGSSSQSSLLD